jgi:NAD(P)H-flavin reductase/ferredoxin
VSLCTLQTSTELASFDVDPSMTLLEAAAAAGFELPHSCRKGVCETCRARIVCGNVAPPADADGTALLCRTYALSDVEVEPTRFERRIAARTHLISARVYQVRRHDADLAFVDLRFPAGTRVPFRAGQHLRLMLPGHSPRAFSMANAPSRNDEARLHVRIVPGGVFGTQVLPGLSRGDSLKVELPFGDFHLRDMPARPTLLVAGGTGFAPIQSLLEDALPKCKDRRFHLYWGARKGSGLYALEVVEGWLRKHPHFRFTGVVSDEPANLPLRVGLVHEVVLADYHDLSCHDVYVCGVPALVAAARETFVGGRGLDPARFFCDSFVTQGDGTGQA